MDKLVVIAALFIQLAILRSIVFGSHYPPTIMKLERNILPPHHANASLTELRRRDEIRHSMFFNTRTYDRVANFTLGGSYNLSFGGLYYTKLLLGSPPREFHLQVDTGSDIIWISCASCPTCPIFTTLSITLNNYDPSSSSTSSILGCSNNKCYKAGVPLFHSQCSWDRCAFSMRYADGSGTKGYYVSDLLHFDMIYANDTKDNSSSAPIIFGCSTQRSGLLSDSFRVVDGILGLGFDDSSLLSQLASTGVITRTLSHCLSGQEGGAFVIGQIVTPRLVYTPLALSGSHYGVDLDSISINGKKLDIDGSILKQSKHNKGVVIDTGSTFSHLVEEAHVVFITSITDVVAPHVQEMMMDGKLQCYVATSSVKIDAIFPQVILAFSGGASLVLNPRDYLVPRSMIGGQGKNSWCVGFLKMKNESVSILGDNVLQNKLFVYDLSNKQIGWTDYNCSKPFKASNITRQDHSNSMKLPSSNIKVVILIILHLLLFSNCFSF